MDIEDARRLSPAEQHERRRQVIRAWKRGAGKARIARDVGLSYPGIRKIIACYEAGGVKALTPRQRGRRVGDKRALAPAQETHIQQLIRDHRPEQLKMEFALWSRAAVGQLVAWECGVRLPVRTVGQYLKRWGFTPQKPIQRAYEQSPVKVKAWLEAEYPAIHQRARVEGAGIHWGDATGLVNTDVRGRSYAPRGQTPVTRVVGGTRRKLSMISTVTNQGKTRWMIIDGAFNHVQFIEFLESLIKDADRKVFLILDNPGVHHCKPVKAWLAEHTRQLEAFFLPSYSPETQSRRTPQRRSQAGHWEPRCRHGLKDKLEAAAKSHMQRLESEPHRVRAYFQDPYVRYAA